MPELKPEERARQWIDRKLEDAGWQVINRNEYVPGMHAVALREAPMRGGLEADYLLLLRGKAVGVVEAKRHEIPLDNASLIHQAENYAKRVQKWCPAWEIPLKFVFLSNGKEIALKDFHELEPKYKLISKFLRPWDFAQKLKLNEFDGLPFLSPKGLRQCQFEALSSLERSFKSGKRRALMVLATGAGKTFTACMLAYRMLAYTPMKRVLFLVDRNNLGVAAKTELQTFKLTESGKPLSEIFGVEHLSNQLLSSRTNIVISTIQRLFSKLSGNDNNLSEIDEDTGSSSDDDKPVELPINPSLPPDYFDLIIIDECHRSIYSKWKAVLNYFLTARLVGMTATPIPETLSFFENNQVANYTYEKSVLDGVNVPYRIYRIKTKVTEEGGEIEAGTQMTVTKRGDKNKYKQTALINRSFDKSQLNRSILVRDQIRKVLQEYKDAVYTKLYPDREANFDYLPKTLIFALTEEHAQSIVDVAKEVFGHTDDKFVQKITYSVENSNELIRRFRNDVDFRIAVTVTLVATGTDVRPLEVLIFFNDVRSETLYAQMKGRGCRTISDSQLRSVTPNANSKELFFIIDAVGVTESEKVVPSLDTEEKKLNPSLAILFERLSFGYIPDDYLYLLASKLSTISRKADPEDLDEYSKISETTPAQWAQRIMDVIEAQTLPPFVSVDSDNRERMDVVRELLTNTAAKNKLIEIARGYLKELPEVKDEVITAEFSKEAALSSTQAFEQYVNVHRDEIEALSLIYNQQTGALTRTMIDELASHLKISIDNFSVERLWNDYAILAPDKVKPLSSDHKAVTHLIQLVRYAYRMINSLYSLTSLAAQRFELWCGQAQRPMTPEQKELFRKIADYIAQNGSCDFRRLRNVMPELISGLLRFCKTPVAANEELFSLNEFILKAA